MNTHKLTTDPHRSAFGADAEIRWGRVHYLTEDLMPQGMIAERDALQDALWSLWGDSLISAKFDGDDITVNVAGGVTARVSGDRWEIVSPGGITWEGAGAGGSHIESVLRAHAMQAGAIAFAMGAPTPDGWVAQDESAPGWHIRGGETGENWESFPEFTADMWRTASGEMLRVDYDQTGVPLWSVHVSDDGGAHWRYVGADDWGTPHGDALVREARRVPMGLIPHRDHEFPCPRFGRYTLRREFPRFGAPMFITSEEP